jgi:hypothetical protein
MGLVADEPMERPSIVVAGGGAAGFFAAITAAEACPGARVQVLEKGPQVLAKVRISGGGRCNVTHASLEPRAFASHYPRGGRALLGALHQFGPADTVQWFAARHVALKAEPDGRMFPVTDRSETIIDCLLDSARRAGVDWWVNSGVDRILVRSDGPFEVHVPGRSPLSAERVLLATGGCRTAAQGGLATALGHTLETPVPSLFTFHLEDAWTRELAGLSVSKVEVSVPGTRLRERGALLFTHTGLSGPAILRLSAWGARVLHGMDYRFPLLVDWLPEQALEVVSAELEARRVGESAKLVANVSLPPIPARLWHELTAQAGLRRDLRWGGLSKGDRHRLAERLKRTPLPVAGKSLSRDEFVTCGGVRLNEVNLKTMESRVCPRLYLAGEVLDIDGITGGFNFQAAWTTGWLAGRAMIGHPRAGVVGESA